MDWLDDLDAYAGETYEPPDPTDEPGPPPALIDEDHVNRLLRGLTGLNRQITKIGAVRDAEVARIDAWADDRLHGLRRRAQWLEDTLKQWMVKVNADDPKLLTKNLPNGVLRLRARQPKVWIAPAGGQVMLDTLESIDSRFVVHTPKLDAKAVAGSTAPGDVMDFFPEGHDGYELREAVLLSWPFPWPWHLVSFPVLALPGVGILVPIERSFSIGAAKGAGDA